MIIVLGSISIHAPIVGCDCSNLRLNQPFHYFNPRTHRGVRLLFLVSYSMIHQFQSTHPSWGATKTRRGRVGRGVISIHAPIVGCDTCLLGLPNNNYDFNPRTHRGVRHCFFKNFRIIINFNPRTHRGVRQDGTIHHSLDVDISIHAPIVGCDQSASFMKLGKGSFQSTHPSWGATIMIYLFIL